ncbi:MAG: prepilin-type N-terminal cleavage/methylation domain-containing protein [Betaproteobacteria bacterium]|nr:prepilin-type N-terminal cleavage/methylation domain-containing protein [Betaproteobacteria bacterium]
MAVGRPRTGHRGFSMLELLLVLIILVLAYSLASPLISNLGSGDLRSSARTVAVALKRARNVAISARHETPLTFNLEDRTITLGGEPKPFQLPPKLDLQLYTVQQELTSDKIAAIRFYPDGSSTGAASPWARAIASSRSTWIG